MSRTSKNANFIDRTFTIIADILIQVFPTSRREKEAFLFFRDGMTLQSEGEFATALASYRESLRLETDPVDRSFILYNIGLIQASNGLLSAALDYYAQALENNPMLPQALNNTAVIYQYRGEQAIESGDVQTSEILFDKAAEYWREAIRLAPDNYIEAQNWLQTTRR